MEKISRASRGRQSVKINGTPVGFEYRPHFHCYYTIFLYSKNTGAPD